MNGVREPLKVALIGCGKIADAHVQEIQRIPQAKLVSVCDRELLMAEQLATRFGIPAHYDDPGNMVAVESPDVVHILTPPGPHLTLAQLCAEAGSHVFIEKPVALTASDTQCLIDIVERHSKKLTVGYIYLYDAAAIRLSELVEAGELGEVIHIESFYGYDLSGAYGSALARDPGHWVHALPGKLLHNTIDHLLNKIVDLAPGEHRDLLAVGWSHSAAAKDLGFSDELRVQFRCGEASAYASFSSHVKPMQHWAKVYGSRRTATLDLTSSTLTFDTSPSLPTALGRLTPPFSRALEQIQVGKSNVRRFLQSDFHFFSGLNKLLRRFYGAIQQGTPVPIPYDNIIRVGKIMDEVFAQVEQGRSRQSGGPIIQTEPVVVAAAK